MPSSSSRSRSGASQPPNNLKGDEESEDPAPASRRRIGPQSQQAEIDLGHLAGWRLDDPHRRRRPNPNRR